MSEHVQARRQIVDSSPAHGAVSKAGRRIRRRPRSARSRLEDRSVRRHGWGELLRRLALGLLAALITARAYWPSEIDPKSGLGLGAWSGCCA